MAFGSKSLTECLKIYAQIEKELLAIVYGCEMFHQYVYGKTVQVDTDHKPPEIIFKKSLQNALPRLQRMLMRFTCQLQAWQRVVHSRHAEPSLPKRTI